jgi:hypothetical protein
MIDLLRDLESSSFRDLAGARLAATVPVSRTLVNRFVAELLRGTTAPVREVDVQPHGGDRFDVVVTMTWPFVPPLRIAFVIERQPAFPASPQLVLRWSLLGAVGALASRFVERLPRGMRLDGDRLTLDLAELAASRGHGHLLPLVSGFELHTAEGRVLFDVALDVR